MTGQTWCIALHIYTHSWVCVKWICRVVVVQFSFYVIIYIFSRCVCAYTIIDRSGCTEETLLLLSFDGALFRCCHRHHHHNDRCGRCRHRNRVSVSVHNKYQSSSVTQIHAQIHRLHYTRQTKRKQCNSKRNSQPNDKHERKQERKKERERNTTHTACKTNIKYKSNEERNEKKRNENINTLNRTRLKEMFVYMLYKGKHTSTRSKKKEEEKKKATLIVSTHGQ